MKTAFEKNGRPYIACLAPDKDRPARPEQIVRQLWIKNSWKNSIIRKN
jgi:hypothetical protein